jgi:hypothetical protein
MAQGKLETNTNISRRETFQHPAVFAVRNNGKTKRPISAIFQRKAMSPHRLAQIHYCEQTDEKFQ